MDDMPGAGTGRSADDSRRLPGRGRQQAAKRAFSAAVRAAADPPDSAIGVPPTIVAGRHALPVTPLRFTVTVRTPLSAPGPPLE
jgi:hypothetical protein